MHDIKFHKSTVHGDVQSAHTIDNRRYYFDAPRRETAQTGSTASAHSGRGEESPSSTGSDQAVDIFVSHISEEKAIARVVVGWMKRTFFQRPLPVFLDEQSVPLGEAWQARIEAALKTAQMMFVVASEKALKARWVTLEIGAAWERGIPIVFLCHTDLTRDTLPLPYVGRRSLDLHTPQCPEQLLTAVAARFQMGALPPLAYSEMAKEVDEAIRAVAGKETPRP